jgi:hypothetical protein
MDAGVRFFVAALLRMTYWGLRMIAKNNQIQVNIPPASYGVSRLNFIKPSLWHIDKVEGQGYTHISIRRVASTVE